MKSEFDKLIRNFHNPSITDEYFNIQKNLIDESLRNSLTNYWAEQKSAVDIMLNSARGGSLKSLTDTLRSNFRIPNLSNQLNNISGPNYLSHNILNFSSPTSLNDEFQKIYKPYSNPFANLSAFDIVEHYDQSSIHRELIDDYINKINQQKSLYEELISNLNSAEEIKENSASDGKNWTLHEWWKSLPIIVQLLIVFILHDIILENINGVASNLISTRVERLLEDNPSISQREINKEIRNLPPSIDEDMIKNMRFVSRSNVYLREKPHSKSQIIDKVKQGQVVTLISKSKSWSEIRFSSQDDGMIIQGWIFNIYLDKFSK